MYIIVYHKITQPNIFWEIAREALPLLPNNIRIHLIFPSDDMKQATCLWEAKSVKDIRNYLDKLVGHVSFNEFQTVNTQFAMGIPLSKFE